MQNFKIGDVVKLKSGSPDMTISSIEPTYKDSKLVPDEYDCTCVWFVEYLPQHYTFNCKTLKLANETQ